MKKKINSDQLRRDVQQALFEKKMSQRELGVQINYSATSLNQWLNSKYPRDEAQIEVALARWLAMQNMTMRDLRKLIYINELLDNADNKEAILAKIFEEKNSPGEAGQT